MMTKRGVLLLTVVTPLALVSCAPRAQPLELTSYRDPYFPETLSLEFAERGFSVDLGEDTHIAGRNFAEGPLGVVEQLLYVHVFWKPRPGRTFADSSTVDATIRYVVATDQGRAVYAGTGFVFKRFKNDGRRLIADIESSELRLVHASGEPPVELGPIAIEGTLTAPRDESLVTDVRRQVELYAAAPEE